MKANNPTFPISHFNGISIHCQPTGKRYSIMEALFWLRTILSFALAAWHMRHTLTGDVWERFHPVFLHVSRRPIVMVLSAMTIGMLCFFAGEVTAQSIETTAPPADSACYWIGVGLGINSIEEGGGTINYHANFQKGHNLFSLRSSVNQEIAILGTPVTIYDLGLLWGPAISHPKWHLSIGGGPSMVWISGPDYYSFTRYSGNTSTVGCALTIQAFHKTNHIGWGICINTNLNSEHSFTSISLNMNLGKLQ
jgi:hypothetical protein